MPASCGSSARRAPAPKTSSQPGRPRPTTVARPPVTAARASDMAATYVVVARYRAATQAAVEYVAVARPSLAPTVAAAHPAVAALRPQPGGRMVGLRLRPPRPPGAAARTCCVLPCSISAALRCWTRLMAAPGRASSGRQPRRCRQPPSSSHRSRLCTPRRGGHPILLLCRQLSRRDCSSSPPRSRLGWRGRALMCAAGRTRCKPGLATGVGCGEAGASVGRARRLRGPNLCGCSPE